MLIGKCFIITNAAIFISPFYAFTVISKMLLKMTYRVIKGYRGITKISITHKEFHWIDVPHEQGDPNQQEYGGCLFFFL